MSGRGKQCVLGVIAARKKTSSDAMHQILDRLRAYGDFEVLVWGEEVVQNEEIEVEEWPLCDCLIAFTSKGFPLTRVKEYVQLRKPFCINDVFTQDIFNNRRMTYEVLEKYGIRSFRRLYADRRGGNKVDVKETDDYIEIDGHRMKKPIVEKPFDGNDHNIYIYYSQSQGGGCRKLFRKVKNKSSDFFPNVNRIRRDGSYCYEEFIVGAKDLKVYTIGPDYAHGEVRKSPARDGIVARNPDGKELRLLTLLTSEERDIARRITRIFRQNVCGFDVIRYNGRPYVIDVNGWSFVKGNMRYYDKCARTVRKLCLGSIRGQRTMSISRPILPSENSLSRAFRDGDNNHILLSLVTVFRHGDRTPKRKIKLKIKQAEILRLFKSSSSKQQIKLRKRKQLKPVAVALEKLISRLCKSHSAKDRALVAHLRVVQRVVHHENKGLKIQLKPKRVIEGRVVECQLACKWGGELTWMGVEQARFYANVFWAEMLRCPTTGTDLYQEATIFSRYKEKRREFLRGLQVYAANESRVKASAKAFIRATLHVEDVPPDTLHSDDRVQEFLDDVTQASSLIDGAKRDVRILVTADDILIQCDPKYTASRADPEPVTLASPRGSPPKFNRKKSKSNETGYDCADSKDHKPKKGPKKGLKNLVTPTLQRVLSGMKSGLGGRPRRGGSGGTGSGADVTDRHGLTEWAMRCLRWLRIPRRSLEELRKMIKGLLKQIQKHVDEARFRARTRNFGTTTFSTEQAPGNPVSQETPGEQDAKSFGMPTSQADSKAEAATETKGKSGERASDNASTSANGPTGYEDFDNEDRETPLYHNETLEELQDRWSTILEEYYDTKNDSFNTTKIPDIYDNIKYDSLHNRGVLKNLRPIYLAAKNVANFVIPSEYGVFKEQKLRIGRAVVQPLLEHIMRNLRRGTESDPTHRATLYFSSESHLHSLRNAILVSDLVKNKTMEKALEAMEINYMAHAVFRLFLDPTRKYDDPFRYYVDVQFAPGAALDPFVFMGEDHLLPVSRPIPIGRVPLSKFQDFVARQN